MYHSVLPICNLRGRLAHMPVSVFVNKLGWIEDRLFCREKERMWRCYEADGRTDGLIDRYLTQPWANGRGMPHHTCGAYVLCWLWVTSCREWAGRTRERERGGESNDGACFVSLSDDATSVSVQSRSDGCLSLLDRALLIIRQLAANETRPAQARCDSEWNNDAFLYLLRAQTLYHSNTKV